MKNYLTEIPESISKQTALAILTSANGSDDETRSAEELKRIAENAILSPSQENFIPCNLANHRYNIICSAPGKVYTYSA